jgi:hypothetical protein
MKYMIFIVLFGFWLALYFGNVGIYLYSTPYTQSDGARMLRCYYLGATRLLTRDIALDGRIGVTCPHKI